MCFSSFSEHTYSSTSNLPEGIASHKSYAPKVPTTTTSVSTPELTAEIRRVTPSLQLLQMKELQTAGRLRSKNPEQGKHPTRQELKTMQQW